MELSFEKMTPNQKNGLLFAGLLVAGFVVYKIFFSNKKSSNTVDSIDMATQTESADLGDGKPRTKANYDLKLSLGSKGLEVGILQKSLKTLGVDGVFGAQTESRLKQATGKTSISLNEFNSYVKDKKPLVDAILTSGNHTDSSFIQTFDTDFLKAWKVGIDSKMPTFLYKSETYNTKGGKNANIPTVDWNKVLNPYK